MTDRIVKSTEIAAPIETVWRALTDHQAFGAWFRVRLDQPFEVGGRSTGMMTYPGFEHVRWEAFVTRMDPPNHFAFRWPHPADWTKPEDDAPTTLVEFTLEETTGGNRVTVVESGFEAIPADRRSAAIRENTGGWEEQMGNIRRYVEG